MESTIERLADRQTEVFLHYWYVEDVREDRVTAHGIVTGHPKLPDSIDINTSMVQSIEIDSEKEQAIIITRSKTVYHCPLNYCRFERQDEYAHLIPGYEEIKEKYEGKIDRPEIEYGKALLVLSDFDNYYFHSLCVKDKDGKVSDHSGYPHVGMFQDSFLINSHGIDLRYYPHYRNIEFYSTQTGGMPLYVENIGRSVIYIKYKGMTFAVQSGERKELCAENAEGDVGKLPDGDLYPAQIL